MDAKLDKLDKAGSLIVSVIKKSKKPLSTYEIAKHAKVSWATANTHCYKLKASGILDSREEEVKFNVKRVVWWIK